MNLPTPPILCIIGRKNSGKTTLTVALTAELRRRGRRVMTVKHGHGFDLDVPGRDSWRHRHEGGSARTVLASPGGFAVVGDWPRGEPSLSDMVANYLSDADIVLAEGFLWSPEPKIEVHREEAHAQPLFGSTTTAPPGAGPTLALVTDEEDLPLPIPVFPLDAAASDGVLFPSPALSRLADFVEATFLIPEEER